MAKAKSPKLRTLITLHALFKHTDEKHRLNSVKLNEFLRPYGLECNKKVLADTADRLREYGIGVDLAGGGPYQGLCLTNRPLPDHELKRLIFAIDTNPYISREQAQELLEALKPAVTVFQEPMLRSSIEAVPQDHRLTAPLPSFDSPIFKTYCMIHEAMSKNHRVCCSTERFEVDKKAKKLVKRRKREQTYLPGYLIEDKNIFYMVAYNHSRQRIEAAALKNIATIRPAQYNNLPEVPELLKMLRSVNPYDYLPREEKLLYEGPATFYCAAKQLQQVFERFGMPCGPVERDERCRYTYPVSHVTITSDTLRWIGDAPELGIRIVGPEALRNALKNYYQETKAALLGTKEDAERR